MGFFDLFSKKRSESADDITLEELLGRAMKEPAYRMSFYKKLLSDNLFVITPNVPSQENCSVLQPGTEVGIQSLEDGRIPVFTSKERIFDNGVVNEQVGFLALRGEDLFELTKGASYFLNPFSDCNKELGVDEIDKLLSGEMFVENAQTIVVQEETKVQIGQPVKYPDQIVASLKVLFGGKPNVSATYLGWIYDPSSGQPPHYIFGLEVSGNYDAIVKEAGFTAQHYLGSGEFVDFIQLGDADGIYPYLKSTTPFYQR